MQVSIGQIGARGGHADYDPFVPGRLVEATPGKSARWRDAKFLDDGKTLLARSDRSGEVEFWTLPANGVGASERQITRDAKVLRWAGTPSADGKWLAHTDKDHQLWVTNMSTGGGKTTLVGVNKIGNFGDIRWSPDGSILRFTVNDPKTYTRSILQASADGGNLHPLLPGWSDAPNECCGMIAAVDGEAVRVYRATNSAASPLRYEIDGLEQYRIQSEIEDAGWELGAIYHSHTRSAPYPSQTDINLAFYPDSLYVIVGLASVEPEVRGYRILDGRVEQAELDVS